MQSSPKTSTLLHPFPQIVVFWPSAPMYREGRKTYYSQDTPIHSPSTPIHPKLLSQSLPMRRRYSLPYQHRVPTTLPLLDSFGLCNLLFGLLLPEYRMKLGDVCFCSSARYSLFSSMVLNYGSTREMKKTNRSYEYEAPNRWSLTSSDPGSGKTL